VPAAQGLRLPDGLTDVAAVTLFEHVARHYNLEPIGASVLLQTCWALQRSNECRVLIDRDGALDETGPKPTAHPLLATERDARGQYLALLNKLGLLD